jgi:DNA primase
VTEKYKRAILWLDDDAAGHDAALKLLRELSPVVPGLTAIFNKQPKEIDIETLQTMEL